MATPKKHPKDLQKRGPKTKLTVSTYREITNYCLCGATNAKLADFLGISEKTFYEWLKTNPKIGEAVYAGRDGATNAVANALFRAATGHKVRSVDIRTVTLPEGGGSEIVKTPVDKYYPPDYKAASFFLRNRKGDAWQEKTEVNATVTVTEYDIELPKPEEKA